MYRNGMIDEIAIRAYEDKNINELLHDPNETISMPVRIIELAQYARTLSNALLVIVNNPGIQEFLKGSDPKALQQCLDALHAEEGEPWNV